MVSCFPRKNIPISFFGQSFGYYRETVDFTSVPRTVIPQFEPMDSRRKSTAPRILVVCMRQGGRAWVARPDQQAIKERKYQPGEWSDLEIHAGGKDVSVLINGILSTELKKDPGRTKGFFWPATPRWAGYACGVQRHPSEKFGQIKNLSKNLIRIPAK